MNIDPDRPIILSVNDEEKWMLDMFRSLKWGKLEVQIQDGAIARMLKIESIKPVGKEKTLDKP
jgi:hypothetical protein